MLKIVADENIPCVHEFFSPYGEVLVLPGRSMSSSDVLDADVLLVRSVTPVNETLLAQSKVKFVGTCTIGVDHLDHDFLNNQGIAYASAPGCNAGGVVQYALSALAHVCEDWQDKRISVIGCGNVGGRLYRTLEALGVDCMGYDPFLTNEQISRLVSFDEALSADIICMHTPLTKVGEFPTYHLLNEEAIAQLSPGTVLLNAGRGGAIDNKALHAAIENGLELTVILDVWEDEPAIYLPLLDKVKIGSPHIAGYSFEGRLNGSKMIHRALATHLSVEKATIDAHEYEVMSAVLGEAILLECRDLNDALRQTYPIFEDDARFKFAMRESNDANAFDRLRKTYWSRREFTQFGVSVTDKTCVNAIKACGFELDLRV